MKALILKRYGGLNTESEDSNPFHRQSMDFRMRAAKVK